MHEVVALEREWVFGLETRLRDHCDALHVQCKQGVAACSASGGLGLKEGSLGAQRPG